MSLANSAKVTVSPAPLPKGAKPKGRTPPAGKKLADDEFMAAAIGDVEWLRQSFRKLPGDQYSFDSNGLAAVHLASIHGRIDCVKFLIEKCKVPVNLASSTGWRPIHLCISNQIGKRAYHCLSYLIEKGADHSVVNDDGVTPVHQAASEGHFQCLKTLIELGADIFREDSRGHMAIDLAKLWGHRNCARVLATEMWHREKDIAARDMRQLKKLRMREVLDELEREEQLLAKERFNNQHSFKTWLAKTTEPQGGKTAAQKVGSGVVPSMSHVRFDEPGDQDDQPPRKPTKPLKKNPVHWNPSCHVTQTFHEYQKALEDVYPRDPLTMMPHPVKSSPQELNIRSRDPRAVLMAETDEALLQELGDRETEAEPNDAVAKNKDSLVHHGNVVQWMYSEEFSPADRQQLFTCQTILDQPQKRKWNLDDAPAKPEVQLHLSSDVTSHLFQHGLVRDRSPGHSRSPPMTATSLHGVRFAEKLVMATPELVK